MSGEKAPTRLDTFPAEILQRIYDYLFGVENTRIDLETQKFVKKVHVKRSWAPRNQLTYVFPTALLRVNRKISQGAQRVLYNDNLLVFIRLMNMSDDFEPAILYIMRKFPSCRYIPIGFVPDKRSLPPCPVIIQHRCHEGESLKRPGSLAMVVSAFDLPDLCRLLGRELMHYDVQKQSYALMALPKVGWPHEQLRSLIWEPLCSLRQSIAWGYIRNRTKAKYYKIKVVEATGTFEPTVKMLEWVAEPEHRSSHVIYDEEHNLTNDGYRTEFDCDQTCLTSSGCRKEYDTDNAEWKSEDSYSKPNIDSDAELGGQFRKSWMETGEMSPMEYKEHNYLGDDELTDDDASELRKGRKKQTRMRLRKRWTRMSRYDYSQRRWIDLAAEQRDQDILAKRDRDIVVNLLFRGGGWQTLAKRD